MKKNRSILLFAIFIITATYNVNAQYKAKNITAKCKPNIPKPYKYDSYVVNEFVFDSKEKTEEVVFSAFQGVKYKLVFCSSEFEESLKMNIYDKSNRVKVGRKKLYDGSQGVDSDFWSFEPAKAGNYYIEYEIPKSNSGTVKKGCVVLLIGYQDK
jgi:hypothetical protein